MAESSNPPADITITVKGPSELKLSITISPSKTVAELKDQIQAASQVEKERQRLIYSGKVLKDDDAIASYKIQNGHTIHMVKGAAKPAPGAVPSGSGTPGGAPRLPQMGTGLNVAGNLGDSIENHHGMAGFNPFANMEGVNNLNDPNAMANMMQNPEFLRSMSDMMSRPEVVDQMIASNPQLAGMGPQIRSMMSNPMVRQMMSNPESLRMIMQMQAAMGGGGGAGGMGAGMGGLGGMGGMFGAPPSTTTGAAAPPSDPFPNLFAPNATANQPAPAGATAGGAPSASQLAALFGGGGMGGGNPFGGAGAGAGGNPFAGIDPAALFGGMGGGGGGWGGAPAAAATPRDTRPPEEIYATQLGQLNAMGLWDAAKNIRALRSTGGNVEAAIELIFSGQMD
ncbi:hypothetical protein P7C73_g159, partial [Tremellales sp. Uapishka_1]